jgi:hypothetical protein
MDMNEWEYYVPCSRLKTKRQKERLRKWDSDKQLMRLHRELTRIRLAQVNLGFKELVPPVQRGWKRIFVVRADVVRSKDGAFFQALLHKINSEQFSHRRDFKQKKRRKGKKVQVEREQKLYEPYAWALKRLKLTEKEKEYFTEVQEFQSKGQYRTKYVFNEPWRYVLKVQPNLITKIKVIDPLLQQQEAEIEALLEKRNLRPRFNRLIYGYHQYGNRWNPEPKAKYKTIFKTESIAKIYDELYNKKNNEKN